MVTYVLPFVVLTVLEYLEASGRSPFRSWFESLNAEAAAKATTALTRMHQGNFSNTKGVGGGVYECRIDFGPGYRIYFSKDGAAIVILLGGGTKKRQQRDITAAMNCWQDYKQRKKARKGEKWL